MLRFIRNLARRAFFVAAALIMSWGVATSAWGEPATGVAQAREAIQPLTSIGAQTTGFRVTCFALAPQGNVVALGGSDGNVRLWSLAESKVIRQFDSGHNSFIGSMDFSPDGKQLAFHADDRPLCLWDIASGIEIARCGEELSLVEQIRFSPCGKRLAFVSEATGFIWNLDSGKTEKLTQPVSALAFSPDGKTLALGFNTLRLVEAASGKLIHEHGKLGGKVSTVAFSSTGSHVLVVDSACPGTFVRQIEAATGDEMLVGEKISSERAGAAYSADDTMIVTTDGMFQVSFWEAQTGRKMQSLAGFHRGASSLVFTPDDRRLLTGFHDGYQTDLQIWDVDALLDFAVENVK